MEKVLLLPVILIPLIARGQQDSPQAPEKWSEPVILETALARRFSIEEGPSLTRNLDGIYLAKDDGLYFSFLIYPASLFLHT